MRVRRPCCSGGALDKFRFGRGSCTSNHAARRSRYGAACARQRSRRGPAPGVEEVGRPAGIVGSPQSRTPGRIRRKRGSRGRRSTQPNPQRCRGPEARAGRRCEPSRSGRRRSIAGQSAQGERSRGRAGRHEGTLPSCGPLVGRIRTRARSDSARIQFHTDLSGARLQRSAHTRLRPSTGVVPCK